MTSIEWTDATWNPLRGCTAVSEGCRNCYAAGQAARFSGPGLPYEGLAKFTPQGPRWTGEVRLVPEHLEDPLRWRKPRRVFVNSMSDLFHPAVSNEFISCVFAVMAAAPQHTFQVLTKRPERMAAWFEWAAQHPHREGPGIGGPLAALGEAICNFEGNLPAPFHEETDLSCLKVAWPLPNVWLGTSVEDQAAAEARIPHLLASPAVVRFLSCEPMLGPVDLRSATAFGMADPETTWAAAARARRRVDWVIVGGESGRGARPMDLAWARSLRDQAQGAGAAFFFKQVGACASEASAKGGALADIPEDLQVRQFPEVRP
ncbi:MAG: phage Gp37/Gp68 family protein [Halobacteriales archaeon]|nr:phage Gp37/Gp68 family protein [Halobacteriales archaeon]